MIFIVCRRRPADPDINAARKSALDKYLAQIHQRGDVSDDPSGRTFPADGIFAWIVPESYSSPRYMNYIAGTGDEEWINQRNRNYVLRLESEGILDEKEPNLSVEMPALYEEVIAKREKFLEAVNKKKEEEINKILVKKDEIIAQIAQNEVKALDLSWLIQTEVNALYGYREHTTKKFTGRVCSSSSITFLGDDLIVFPTANQTVQIINITTGKIPTIFQGFRAIVESAVLLKNGLVACSASYANADPKIRLYDPKSGQFIRELSGHTAGANAIISLKNGNIASGADDRTIKIWDPDTGNCLKTFSDSSAMIRALAELVDGNLIYGLWGGTDQRLKIINQATGETKVLGKHRGLITSILALSESIVVSASSDEKSKTGSIKFWDIIIGACTKTLNYSEKVLSMAVTRSGNLAVGTDSKLYVLDPQKCSCLSEINVFGGVCGILALPDGRLVVGNTNGVLKCLTFPELEVIQKRKNALQSIIVALKNNGSITEIKWPEDSSISFESKRQIEDIVARNFSSNCSMDDFVPKTLKLLNENLHKIDITGDKQAIIVMGRTGVGKTTLINLLAGVNLDGVGDYDECLQIRASVPLPGFEIGESVISQTSMPNKWRSMDGAVYWDCPGFMDNRGLEYEIINAVCIKKLFHTPFIKLVIVISDDQLSDPKLVIFRSLVEHLGYLFSGSINSINSAISLIVSMGTRARTVDHVRANLKRLLDSAAELGVTDVQQSIVKALMKNIGFFRRPTAKGPINVDETQDEVKRIVESARYAQNLRVNVVVSEVAERGMVTCCDRIQEAIDASISRFTANFKFAIQKIAAQFMHRAKFVESTRSYISKCGLWNDIINTLINFEDTLGLIIDERNSKKEDLRREKAVGSMIDACLNVARKCSPDNKVDVVATALIKFNGIKFFSGKNANYTGMRTSDEEAKEKLLEVINKCVEIMRLYGIDMGFVDLKELVKQMESLKFLMEIITQKNRSNVSRNFCSYVEKLIDNLKLHVGIVERIVENYRIIVTQMLVEAKGKEMAKIGSGLEEMKKVVEAEKARIEMEMKAY